MLLITQKNAFSALSQFGFNFHSMLVVDFLHEVELGLLKNLFAHFVRVLDCFPMDRVSELNRRYEISKSSCELY